MGGDEGVDCSGKVVGVGGYDGGVEELGLADHRLEGAGGGGRVPWAGLGEAVGQDVAVGPCQLRHLVVRPVVDFIKNCIKLLKIFEI